MTHFSQNAQTSSHTNKQIRQLALSKRDSLTSEKKTQLSQAICNQLLQYINGEAIEKIQSNQSFVAIYLATKNEADLTVFINWAFQQSINLCAPIIQKKYGEMDFFALHPDTLLKTNRLAIKEPIIASNEMVEKKVSKNQIAIAIFPLSAFDQKGHRIGMGGGFYDRYFQDCAAKRIGVAYELQKIKTGKITRQAHDLKLDALVSEQKIYRF